MEAAVAAAVVAMVTAGVMRIAAGIGRLLVVVVEGVCEEDH